MARPRTVSDQELLDAARACFLEHGPGVSTAHIAREVGVSQATLFKRFGTKAALMAKALLPRTEGPHWKAIAAPPSEAPICEQLVERGVLIMRFFNELQPCLAMMRAHSRDALEQLIGSDQPPPVRALRALQGFFDALVDQGRLRPVHTESLTLMWLGALRNRAFWNHMMPNVALELDDEAFVREVTESLWTGLAPEEAP